MELTLLQLTPDYVVCVKPQGMESQYELPALLEQQTGSAPFLPVHRLDKETGGLMVYARTPQAAALLSRQFQEHKTEKSYLAVVAGCPHPPQGEYEDLLFRDKQKNKSYIVKRERKGVKKASLSYRVLATVDGKSLVAVRLHTGRTHQIRVQFSGRQMPLLGDKKYGGRTAHALALWSASLSFTDSQGHRQAFTHSPPAAPPWDCFKKEKMQIDR